MNINDELYDISKDVMEQYEKIWESGITDMYNYPNVAYIAAQMGFDALSEVANDLQAYSHLLMNFGYYMKKYKIVQKARERGKP